MTDVLVTVLTFAAMIGVGLWVARRDHRDHRR